MTELDVAGQEELQVDDQLGFQPTDAAPTGSEDDGMYVRVRRDMYGQLAPDGDFNKVIHMAKQQRESEENGLYALGQKISDQGLNAYGVLADWNAPVEEAPQPQAQQQEQGQWVTQDQLAELVKEKVGSTVDERFNSQAQQAQQTEAFNAQQSNITAALDTLGYKSKKTKFTLAGTDHELSPVRDLIIDPAMRLTAQRIHEQGLNPNAPDYQDRLYGPMSAQTIQEAATVVKQVMALIGQQQLELESDNQADLPQASLGDGPPGGRVKKNVADMTPAEKKAEFKAWEAKKRAKRDG